MSIRPARDEDRDRLWQDLATRLLSNTLSHPVKYAKVLIQIGYEPIAPRPTYTFFRQPALALPNIFQYVKYIKSVDGLSGCYRGFVPRLCAYTLSTIAFKEISKHIRIEDERNESVYDEDVPIERRRKRHIQECIRDLITKMVGIIVSHPFDVIMIRMMAQFVGRETKYSGLIGSFKEVYRENGIMGYYAGIVPRLIANASLLVLVCTSACCIEYVVHDREIKTYAMAIMRFLSATITYPCLVVSHCMAVNNCGLAAGLPPRMPVYSSWLDCWAQLAMQNQLKRGSSMLWRYYKGPQVIVDGKLMAINKDDFYLQNGKQY
ncbi:hypothetical protein KM043_010585 [Ampulex compressa]|nr:hypothetical protein KM043_010585 [Ampulex compressa]